VTGERGKDKGKKEGRQRGRADRELPEFFPEIACCNRRGELIGYDSPAVEFECEVRGSTDDISLLRCCLCFAEPFLGDSFGKCSKLGFGGEP